jgi:hypothetical protein
VSDIELGRRNGKHFVQHITVYYEALRLHQRRELNKVMDYEQMFFIPTNIIDPA